MSEDLLRIGAACPSCGKRLKIRIPPEERDLARTLPPDRLRLRDHVPPDGAALRRGGLVIVDQSEC